MKYIKTSLIVTLLLMVGSFSQSYSEESFQDLPAVRIEAEGVPYVIIRVGSPLYNFLRDLGRSMESENITFLNTTNMTDLGKALLQVDSEYENLEPNSFLILKGAQFLKGNIYIPFSGTKAKYYLYRESLGLVELLAESVLNGITVLQGRAMGQPVAATLSAILSNASLGQRLENNALAIWESSKAPVYAFLDLFNN